LFSQVDPVRANFEAARDNHHLINKIHFNWLPPGEVVYFLARKHPILLLKSLIPPLLLLIGPIYLFFYSFKAFNNLPLILAFILLGIVVLWVILARINWANDHYLVTNKRVIWLEKVIGFYDSRQEAPLETILSVGVETNIIGRWLNYGDVIVRTYVGQIKFYHVHRPNHAASLVEEHWVRSREKVRKNDNEAMQEIIHKKLGYVEDGDMEQEQTMSAVQSTVKPGWIQVWFSDIFKTRLEERGTITYRKHWLVLIKSTWIPGMLSVMLLAMLIYQVAYVPFTGSKLPVPINLDTLIGAMVAILFGVLGWWLYNYLDWRNDIYQITPDQVFDIKKRPLGREEHQVAPLDNILSTEYKRIGLIQVLFNYGNVYITVGGSELVFENVADPITVQKDIDMVRLALVDRKNESDNKAERERLADWIAVYHNDPLTRAQGSTPGDRTNFDEHDVQ
ncbi:PH domain-containing protein, partial [Chloroflexota bacterium]